MPRPTTLLVLFLAPLTARVSSAEDPTKKDIRCEAEGNYIGNFISPKFTLRISGPDEKTWSYRYSDNQSGTLKNPAIRDVKGTYELKDGLVVFTGKTTLTNDGRQEQAEEVRFGVNYGFPNGEVWFDRLFPSEDGVLRYRRRWYTKRDKDWHLVEERSLSVPSKPLVEKAKTWEVAVTGERTRWDKDGKKTVERAEERIVYKLADSGVGYYTEKPPTREWLPAELHPTFLKGRVAAAAIAAAGIGELRGLPPRSIPLQ